MKIIIGIILIAICLEFFVRILLGIKFQTFGKKKFWEVIRYPIGVMDWRVFKGFGEIQAKRSKKLFRFSTQSAEMGITTDQLLTIMAKANQSTLAEVTKAYQGEQGFEKTYYRPFVGFCTRPGQHLSYADIDPLGFQGGYKKIHKDPDVKRVLLLGGSVAFGKGCLSKENSLTSKLEKFLNQKEKEFGSKIRWEVINCAFISAQSLSELNQAIIYSKLFSPDIIVQFSGYNDLNFFLTQKKLYTYHWQNRVIDYLSTPLWAKCLDQLSDRSFALRGVRKTLGLRPKRVEGQLYTVW